MELLSGAALNGVHIPENAVIQCPEKGFELIYARRCENCKHSKGMLDVNPQSADWNQRYRIVCGRPIARSTQLLEVN